MDSNPLSRSQDLRPVSMRRFVQLFDEWNRHWKSTKEPAILIAFGYCLLVGFALSRHEMWRDEMEAWLIARDSESLPQLLGNLKNEGHPALWYVLLMPLTRLSHSPELMQVLHLCIATATVYLVARYSPLSRIQVLLFPLGFFVLWQYAVVSRDYALGVLLLVAFCVLYPRRYELFPAMGVVLMLAAHTHALTLILVIAIAIGLAVDVGTRLQRDRNDLDSRRRLILGFGLMVVGIGSSIMQLIPDSRYVGPTDSFFESVRNHALAIGVAALFGAGVVSVVLCRLRERLAEVLIYVLAAIGIVLYTESSVLGAIVGASGMKILAFLGLIAYVFLLFQFRDRLSLLILYGLGITGLAVFFTWIFSGGPHHYGMLYIIVFMGYWLERLTRGHSSESVRTRRSMMADVGFTVILVSQSIFGVSALYQDIKAPYSNGKSVAQYIQSRGWESMPIVGCMDFTAQTVIGYLGVKQIYYPQGDRWGSYVLWDWKRRENVGLVPCLKAAESLGRDVLVVSSYADESPPKTTPFVEVAEFKGALRIDENFVLYRSKAAEGKD